MDYINILICSDKNYIMPTAVLLKSLSLNNRTILNNSHEDILTRKSNTSIYAVDNLSINVYILNSDLDHSDISNLKHIVNERNINIISLKVNEDDFKDLPVSGHISKSAYYRILSSELLPETVDRVLYLDCDIIINGSIKELYFEDFEDNYLIACEDKVISCSDEKVYKNLSLDISKDKYFNSGVILFNIKALRDINNFKNKLFEYIEQNSNKFIFHDQDILNGFFKGKVKFADYFIYNNLVKWITNKSDLKRAYEKTVIFHYADKWKPWKYNYIGYADEIFWKYACLTDYKYLYKKYKYKHFFRKLIPFNVLRKIKRLIF